MNLPTAQIAIYGLMITIPLSWIGYCLWKRRKSYFKICKNDTNNIKRQNSSKD